MRKKVYIKEMNQFREELSKSNQEKFDQILLQIRFSNINDHDAEEFCHHCLDLFLQAERNNVPIESILNTTDLDMFSRAFIDETLNGYSFVQKVYWKLHHLPLILFIFTGIFEMLTGYLIKGWVNQETVLMVPVTISMVINTLFVMLFTYILLNHCYYFYSIFNGEDKRKDRIVTILFWLFNCGLIGIFVLTKLYLNQTLFSINYLVFMGVLGLILIIQHIFENKNC